jgi:hypothetical protein
VSEESEIVAFVFASEIGPGFSPDIQTGDQWGFSPWDRLSSPQAERPREEGLSQGAEAPFVLVP